MPIQVSRTFGRVALVGELGYQFLHEEEDEWIYGLLGALRTSDDLELLAEIHGTTTRDLDNWDPVINVGLRRNLGERFKLLASVGTGIGSDDDRTRFVAYLGIQLFLGRERQ